jgi:uncharacterized membrane protein YhiD involved in acid resistance
MATDINLELMMAVRLVLAAVAGAAIGLEREFHSHPAGMRTHLLVALGAAMFTVLSMHGFPDLAGQPSVTLDPSRVAAQIVSGIGFLGGGAILKYGASIRGLTTAGSLWATAAMGFAFGSGLLVLGALGTLIVIFSLWPLNVILDHLRTGWSSSQDVRLGLERLETLTLVYADLVAMRTEVLALDSRRMGKNRYEVTMRLRLASATSLGDIKSRLARLSGVDVMDAPASTY